MSLKRKCIESKIPVEYDETTKNTLIDVLGVVFVPEILNLVVEYDKIVISFSLPKKKSTSLFALVLQLNSHLADTFIAETILKAFPDIHPYGHDCGPVDVTMIVGRTDKPGQMIVLITGLEPPTCKIPCIESNGRIARQTFQTTHDYITILGNIMRTCFHSNLVFATVNELNESDFGALYMNTITGHGYECYPEFCSPDANCYPETSSGRGDILPDLFLARKNGGCTLDRDMEPGLLCECDICAGETHHFCRGTRRSKCSNLDECGCECDKCANQLDFKEGPHCQNDITCFHGWRLRNDLR